MKFLVDAQLPARLAQFLLSAGHNTLHTAELPKGNRTTDIEIAAIADAEERIVITKDRDFRDSHLLRGTPRHLLVVMTGNITNNDLLVLFTLNCNAILAALKEAQLVEMRSDQLITHPNKPTE